MTEKELKEGLNDLLTKNYNTEKGLATAANQTDSPLLSAFYRNLASNRYSYGHQIKDILREMEAEIDKGTSLGGELSNAWINFRSLLSLDKEEAILDAIEEGEESCVEEYNDFLAHSAIPQSVRRIITYQRDQIVRSLQKIEQLEEQYD